MLNVTFILLDILVDAEYGVIKSMDEIDAVGHRVVHGGEKFADSVLITPAVMEALDGLPPVKVHCSLLAEEAIHAALWDYAEKNGIKIEGLEKPKTDISEGEEEEEY